MKKLFFLPLALLTFTFFSCTDDDNDDDVVVSSAESLQVANLHADAVTEFGATGPINSGEFTKFDFETGTETDSETEWDIAFRTTTIAINGGAETGAIDEPVRNGSVEAAIIDGSYADLSSADDISFFQDSTDGFAIPTGSDNGWYNYNGETNLVTPIPGKVLVIKTRNGNYAKVQIVSYYLDQDTTSESRYYTFNYVYNTEVGNTSFE